PIKIVIATTGHLSSMVSLLKAIRSPGPVYAPSDSKAKDESSKKKAPLLFSHTDQPGPRCPPRFMMQ
ncbi:MAG: hypothetical protein ABI988_18935, partial [Nitrospirota bacterium]